MVARMTMEGRRELARKFERELPRRVVQPVQAAVVKGAEQVAAMQRALVAVDDGDLKATIHVTKPGETTPPHSQPGGERQAGPFEAVVTAGGQVNGRDVRTAHFVEFDTDAHINAGKFAGTRHPGTKAQPFFFTGYRLVKKRVRSATKRAITKAFKDAAKQ